MYHPSLGKLTLATPALRQLFRPLFFLFLVLFGISLAESALAQSNPYINTFTAGNARRDFTGFLGMRIVPQTSITVTELGHLFINGNTGNHRVKIYNHSTGQDVANSTVTVAMTGGVHNQFKYVALPTPVTLNTGQEYFILGEEFSTSADQWYNNNSTVSVESSVATCVGSAYWNGSSYTRNGAGNTTYLTASFKYTTGSSNSYISTFTAGNARRDFTGFLGMRIIPQTSISVTHLGHIFITGNTGSHRVKIHNNTTGQDVGGTVTVSMAGGSHNQFNFVALPAPVTLTPGEEYFILGEESTASADQWYNNNSTVTVQSSAATCIGSVYWNGSSYTRNGGANMPYITANFRYTGGASNAPPSIAITSPGPGATFTAPANVPINADAVDSDGTVSKVDFYYNGSNLIGTDNTYPYAISWSNAAAGSYSLTAKATDNAGAVTTSAAVNITVNPSSSATPYIISQSPSSLHPGHTGDVGMQITVGSGNITVSELGRFFITGNSGNHTLKIVSSGGGTVTSTTINMSGGTNLQFKYVAISPVTLNAGQVYYIVSSETSGGDRFHDTSAPSTTNVATCNGGIYHDGTNYVSGGPVPYLLTNFKYTGGGSPPGGITSYPGPVHINPVAPRSASLHVERAGTQSSALDIFGSSGDAIRFWATDNSTRMRGRFKNTGEYLTNGWFVISGSYGGTLANPNILLPTADNSMVEIWSNVAGSAVTLRPHSTGTNASLATMDKDGKYRFSISPGGTLNFAGPNSNTFGSAGFDTSLYRTGPGAISTNGSFSAASFNDTDVTLTMVNNSTRTVQAGDVLVLDPGRDDAFLPSSPHSDNDVAGVARETIRAGEWGSVIVLGLHEVSVKGTVNRGDRVVKGSEAGTGRRANAGEEVPVGAVVGKALKGTAGGGKIDVLITAGN